MWDKTRPPNTDIVRKGDDELREIRVDLQYAFEFDHDFTDIKLKHKVLSGVEAARPATRADSSRLFFNETTNKLQLEKDPDWIDIAEVIPQEVIAGETTKMVFNRTEAVPVGWETVLNDGRYLRMVNSVGGGVGGSDTNFIIDLSEVNVSHNHSVTGSIGAAKDMTYNFPTTQKRGITSTDPVDTVVYRHYLANNHSLTNSIIANTTSHVHNVSVSHEAAIKYKKVVICQKTFVP